MSHKDGKAAPGLGLGAADGPVRKIPLDRITPDRNQPRTEFPDELVEARAESMHALGQLAPIRVRPLGRPISRLTIFCLIDGEVRFRAAKRLGWKTIECVVDEAKHEPGELLLMQLASNSGEPLGPVDLAAAVRALTDGHGLSTREIGRRTGLSQATIARALALGELPGPVLALVESGELAARTAVEIGRHPDPAAQVELARRAAAEHLPRGQVVALVQAARPEPEVSPRDSGEVLSESPAPIAPRPADPPPTGPAKGALPALRAAAGQLMQAAVEEEIRAAAAEEWASVESDPDPEPDEDPTVRMANHPALTGKPTVRETPVGRFRVRECGNMATLVGDGCQVGLRWSGDEGPLPLLVDALRAMLSLYDAAEADPFPPGTVVRFRRAGHECDGLVGEVCGRLHRERPELYTVRVVTANGDPITIPTTVDHLERAS